MTQEVEAAAAEVDDPKRIRFSVSLVKQGKSQFYTLTMPSEVLARTCKVSTRNEDPAAGFQRELDEKRAKDIANYIDNEQGTIPSSVVLSAQEDAELKVVGRGKTLEFNDTPGAFLILDGQHRVFGFSKAQTSLRVPVVIYNGLSRRDETRLFIDINTKQKPVPSQLLLDIKNLADIETDTEQFLRDVFDLFHNRRDSVLKNRTSPSEASRNKLNRVTFNQAVKPILPLFSERETEEVYEILNAFLWALAAELETKTDEFLLSKPVVFRAFMGFFRSVAQRLVDRHGSEYSTENFTSVVSPVFQNMRIARLERPGTSSAALRDYLVDRLGAKLTL
ncbi:DGQHR domain-containing protein [uncultured Roseobacter sp.]|uniref:DGQHR domain-containing protein n=1 Tax=uncultured Roseobacter sp. TaxID=114847 RepID=UPI002621E2FC|nr:DGQHR domain-containing protein [uncultured Roseobacter sp.]